MLVVPRVAVRERRAVADAGDLVPVVPPTQNARVFRGVVAEPPVPLAVVVDEHGRPVPELSLEHDAGVRHVASHRLAVLRKYLPTHVEQIQGSDSHHGADDHEERLVVQLHYRLRHLQTKHRIARLLGPDRLLGRLLRAVRFDRIDIRVGRHEPDILHHKIGGQHRALHNPAKEPAQRDAAQRRRNRPEQDHEPRHLRREVVRDRAVRQQEHLRVRAPKEAHDEPDRRDVVDIRQELQIRLRRRRLVLRHRVHQRVPRPRVLHKQRPHPRRNRPEVPHRQKHRDDRDEPDPEHARDLELEHPRVVRAHLLLLADGLAKLQRLEPHEHDEGAQLLQRLERRPPHHRNKHRARGAHRVEQGVGAVQLLGVAAGHDEQRGVERDHVEDEDVAAPCHDHVDVRDARQQPEEVRVRRRDLVRGEEHFRDQRRQIVPARRRHRRF
mmetsp:Transcript_10633/g.27897  ORF Transcript_10633/g.27897 Transcript_10633/m.27897 type:complete len:439 (+) Transcript_10633:744-2060(+)